MKDNQNSNKSISSVGIILKPYNISSYNSVLPNLCSWLKRRKITISFPIDDKNRIEKILKNSTGNINFKSLKELHKETDLNLTLGGDGTLLGFGRISERNSAPIFGINMGNLGFITEYHKSEFFEGLGPILKGQYDLHKIPLFKVEIREGNKSISTSYFLNDLVIGKNDISRIFSFSVESSNEHIFNLSGDGLIVSSPIGSTAYSLAAGGPIIHPSVHALVLTPICPHSLSHRPIVVDDKEEIIIRIPAKSDSLTATMDGQEMKSLSSRSVIIISKSTSRSVKLITNPNRTYFDTLKEKFTHGRS